MSDDAKVTPLHEETRAVLGTAEAARHLGRHQQTLRRWAMLKNGPLSPVKIAGRLAWKVEDLRRITSGN